MSYADCTPGREPRSVATSFISLFPCWTWVSRFRLCFLPPLVPGGNLCGYVARVFCGPDILPLSEPTVSEHRRKLRGLNPAIEGKSPLHLCFASLTTGLASRQLCDFSTQCASTTTHALFQWLFSRWVRVDWLTFEIWGGELVQTVCVGLPSLVNSSVQAVTFT